MKNATVITHPLILTPGTLLFAPQGHCQRKENQGDAPAAVGLGHGYVRQGGAAGKRIR